MTKQQLDQLSNSLLEEYLSIRDDEEVCKCVKELKAPQYAKTLFFKAIMLVLEKSEKDRNGVNSLFLALNKDGQLDKDAISEGLDMVTEQLADLCVDIPMVYSYVGGIIGGMIVDELMSLEEIAHALRGGTFLKVFIETLRSLNTKIGGEKLYESFKDSKVEMYAMMPAARRNEADLTEVLSDGGLMCLSPMLQLQSMLQAQLKEHVDFSNTTDDEDEVHPGAEVISKWLADLPNAMKEGNTYIITVARAIIDYVASQTTLKAENKDATAAQMKVIKNDEENYFRVISPVLETLCVDDDTKQTMVVYAVQWYCDVKNHPKGRCIFWLFWFPGYVLLPPS